MKFSLYPNKSWVLLLPICVFSSVCLFSNSLVAQTIAEKKAGTVNGGGDFDRNTQELLKTVNTDLTSKEDELHRLYKRAQELYDQHAPPADFRDLLAEINAARTDITATSETWRDAISHGPKGEGYALWNQPQTTLEQLIMDFGSREYVYVVPPEIAQIKISIASTIPVPRALWGEMLELILSQNGVGIRQLNPYLRVLYLIKQNQAGLSLVTNNRDDLEFVPSSARVGFLISPDPSEVRRVGFFLERFMNPNTTTLQMVGRDMLIVSTVAEIKELLKLYEFVASTRGQTDYKLVPLFKVDTDEMTKVLQSMFEQFSQQETVFQTDDKKAKITQAPKETHGLKVIPLKEVANAVFLVGTREEIERAEAIIKEVETSVVSARERIVWTYKVKHSDPEDLAVVLEKIYNLLLEEGIDRNRMRKLDLDILANGGIPPQGGFFQNPGPFPNQGGVFPNGGFFPNQGGFFPNQGRYPGDMSAFAPVQPQINIIQDRGRPGMYHNPFPTVVDDTPGFYQNGQVTINPTPIESVPFVRKEYNRGRENFLVDPRSSIVVMVIEPTLLPRMKALVKRLDIPKTMVQLDVLLVEYRNKHTNNYGLNLLSIGGFASNTRHTTMRFDDLGQLTGAPILGVPTLADGVTEFLLSRPKHGNAPAFDLAYRFLMTREDASVNANPSIVTMNEEEASIQIKEEISISTGIVEVVGTNQNVGPKDAFTRAQYGTEITITPTIHTKGDEPEDLWDDSPDYVTLKNRVLFDDVLPSADPERPGVLRRLIENVVRVADGQTVIIGGLKRKDILDQKQMIPFLGELPCVGKAFSNTEMSDTTTEMFVFITPTIIYDQCEGVEKVKRDQFFRRPGDIPYFLCAVDEARQLERERNFTQGMQILFGREREECVPWGDDACDRLRSKGQQTGCPMYYDSETGRCSGSYFTIH